MESNTVTQELQTIRLSERDQALVVAYVDTGDWAESALKLGLGKREAQHIVATASQSPAVLAAVHAEIGRRLVEGAAIGFRVLLEIARAGADTAADKKLKLEAAKELLKLGGHVGPRAKSQEDKAGKQLHEMTLDDLRRQRDALEREFADRSRPVNAQNAQPAASEDFDLIGD